MGWKRTAEPVLTRMPSVARPEGHVPFKRKMGWTAAVLVTYFFLTNITLFGLSQGGGSDIFGQFRSILAGSQGSILQLGIGPIVTASIVLQLLGGANLLGLDTNEPRDQVLYQGLQKLLVVVMVILTGAPMVFSGGPSGGFLPAANSLTVGGLTLGATALQWVIFAQVFIGGILILFLDEIVSKWGVGSGVGLFIIAGVSQRLVGGFITVDALPGEVVGFIPTWIEILTGARDVPSPVSPPG